MIKIIWFSICAGVLLCGCTAVGLGIGIVAHEGPEYKAIHQLELLRELEPGTEIILELLNGETEEGEFQSLEEFNKVEAGYNQKYSTNFKDGFWKITLEINYINYTYSSNEINTISVVTKEGDDAVGIGFLVGFAIDTIIILAILLSFDDFTGG